MLCSIDLNTSKDLEFTLQIFGTSASNKVEARFMIVGVDYTIACNCKQLEGGSGIMVHVPKLEGIIPAGVYKARFEVVLGDKFFVPVEDEIELVAPVKVTATMTTAETEATVVTMKMATPEVTEVTKATTVKARVKKAPTAATEDSGLFDTLLKRQPKA